MRKFQLLILTGALVGLAIMAAPAALATHSPGSQITPTSTPSVTSTPTLTATPSPQDGGGHSGLDKLKNTLLKFQEALNGPMNLVKWMVDPRGVLETIMTYFIENIGGQAALTSASQPIPIGAIPIPPGDWYLTGGAIGGLNNLTAGLLSTPPASGIYYAQRVWHRINGTAYASNGVGFGSNLINLLKIWQAFRDFSYALFALVFLGAGLMIMMRMKISQQAVMSIENALPKLVGALVLITFSYAIAGFMIDLMYVFIGVIMKLLQMRNLLPNYSFISKLPLIPGTQLMSIIQPSASNMMGGSMLSLTPTVFLSINAASVLGQVMGSVFPVVGTMAGGALFPLIWMVMLLYLGIKIFLALIKTYVAIIVLIIFAPVQIAAGAMPGSKSGFGSWLKNLTANLLVFPTMILVLMIGGYLSINTQSLWYPPFLGPVVGDIGIGSIFAGKLASAAIAIGVMMMLPAIPKTIKRAMGIEGGMFAEATGGLIAGLMAATAPIRKAGQVVQGGVERKLGAESADRISALFKKNTKTAGGGGANSSNSVASQGNPWAGGGSASSD